MQLETGQKVIHLCHEALWASAQLLKVVNFSQHSYTRKWDTLCTAKEELGSLMARELGLTWQTRCLRPTWTGATTTQRRTTTRKKTRDEDCFEAVVVVHGGGHHGALVDINSANSIIYNGRRRDEDTHSSSGDNSDLPERPFSVFFSFWDVGPRKNLGGRRNRRHFWGVITRRACCPRC